ncbi:MAG: thermonuclease family protein [Acidobacteria bacterium]|nr:thermonuclease family protein [Acidobacteriota bacterium]
MAVRAQVREVIDGDTFRTAKIIRLANVDAPELSQPGGQAAKKKLESLIGGKEVVYDEKAHDNYGRIVAQVSVDGLDVNAAMNRYLAG